MPYSYKYNNANGFRPDSYVLEVHTCALSKALSPGVLNSVYVESALTLTLLPSRHMAHNYAAFSLCLSRSELLRLFGQCKLLYSGTGEEEDGSLSTLKKDGEYLKSSCDIFGPVSLSL